MSHTAFAEHARPGNRSLFPQLRFGVYANHASISPVSEAVHAAVNDAMAASASLGMACYAQELERRERVRAQFAGLIGARSGEEIGLVANTSAAILSIAHSLPWREGDRILILRGEFPTNVTPWQQTARRHGLELVWMDAEDFRTDRDGALEALETQLRHGIRLLAVSAVQFTTGQRMPLETMGALCQRHGAQLLVDAIQAVGAVPIDVQQAGIHYLACGSHKWLMGPEGVGFIYVEPSAATQLQPNNAAWLSHEDAFAFLSGGEEELRYDRPFQQGARMLEIGTPNTLGAAGLEASMELIQSIGVDNIFAHIQAWHDALEPGLSERGFVSARMPAPEERSGILSVRPPDHRTAADWSRDLSEQGISCASPAGWLRFAPHWPNALDEAARLLEAIDCILTDHPAR